MVVAARRLNSVNRVLRRVTDYSAIDAILMTWAHDRKLHVFASSVPLLTKDSQIGANLRVCADEKDRADFDQRS